ncbi:tetratricopeptide repeat protein [Prolixibacteraceae bacterium Z1-6]|uniref:Tetratricopeptide repeat protein n=1 Tax=Draconibacterium aestuarii TaxID=2998507 RepID=A0A9X3F9E9_9BACT|nr:tetratricopeptide repeat protein [Prolixibacteraceae bacterium Z1-6]
MNKRLLLFYLFIVCTIVGSYAQDSKTDSLKMLFQSAVDDSTRVELLNAISYTIFASKPAEAIDYGNQALELSEKIEYKKGIAYAFKNIGLGHYMLGDFLEVLSYWEQSLNVFEDLEDKLGVANILNNLGAIYFNQGDDAKAIDLYLRSLRVSEQIGDTLRIATALINIGGVYYNKLSTHNKALEYYRQAIPLSETLGDKGAIGTASINIGEIYLERDQDSTALVYFEKSYLAWKGTGRVPYSMTRIGDVYSKRGEYQSALNFYNEAIDIAKKYDAKLELIRPLLGIAQTYTLTGNYKMALDAYKEARITAAEIGSNYQLKDAYLGMASTFAKMADYKNAFKYQTLFSDIKDTLFNTETDDKIKGLQFSYEMDKKQNEINLLTKDRELQEMAFQKQRAVKNSFLAGLVLILIIAFILFKNYRDKVKVNRILDKQKDEIESLLLNILPKKIAKELRRKGFATPRNYESVTVLFTDFKDFTKISAQLTSAELVQELNDYFMAFDDIVEKHNLEKIKTIGDAYMCAGGLPVKNDTHAVDAVRAALEMQKFMRLKNEKRSELGQTAWGLRVGIHTGPIMAGVVGRKKYAYDIWGSTVNVASRMESNGEVDKVNISSTTYNLVKENFQCLYRGKISAKNVGEIDMHFIEHEINET